MDWRVALGLARAAARSSTSCCAIFNRRIKPIYTAARERAGDVTTRLQENLSGVVVIKIFGREKQEAERFEAATETYYREQIRAINARSLFFPFTRSVGLLQQHLHDRRRRVF